MAFKPVGSAIRTSRNWRLLGFYVGVPVSIAIYASLNNWELLAAAGYRGALAFYVAHALAPFWTTCLLCSLTMRVLERWKPAPSIIMAIGALLGAMVTLPYTNWLTRLAAGSWPDIHLQQQIAPMFSAEFWRYTARATAVWFGVNFIFDRFLGLPRYRYTVPRGYDFREAPTNTRPVENAVGNGEKTIEERHQPAFLARIPQRIALTDVLAIKAEQHYIRVFTPDRIFMVLYRFGDAINELDSDLGLQVHRSYWVNKNAIDCIRPRAKKFSLRLTGGIEIPVSIPYHNTVKDLAHKLGLPSLSS